MTAVTFSGGVHPRYEKHRTAATAIAPLPAPEEVAVPLIQHIGAPARACVSPGDGVAVGQEIGEPGGFVSASVHSPVSGKVKGVEPRPGPAGPPVTSVIIENDGEDRPVEMEGLGDGWRSVDPADLRDRVRGAGIVGMGGAAFPTHVKLAPPEGKPIDTVILNGAECEPYLTADHRIMLERPGDVVAGLEIAIRILGAAEGVIGIEKNKPDAVESVSRAAEGAGMRVIPLEVKYPQGAEKQLIDAILARRVPSGGLPMDVGVVVQNVGTAAAIADAVVRGRPLYERTVTVTGASVPAPGNLLARVGTPISALLSAAGVDLSGAGKLVLGGPMMGLAQTGDGVAVAKGTSGVLVLGADEVDARPPLPCIRCGRCVRACPMGLVPTDIGSCAVKGMVERAEAQGALDCIECGSCAFDCPSRIPLVQQIRLAKASIAAAKRKRGDGR